MKTFEITIKNLEAGTSKIIITNTFVLVTNEDESLHMSEPDAASLILSGKFKNQPDDIPIDHKNGIYSEDTEESAKQKIDNDDGEETTKKKPTKEQLRQLARRIRQQGDNH